MRPETVVTTSDLRDRQSTPIPMSQRDAPPPFSQDDYNRPPQYVSDYYGNSNNRSHRAHIDSGASTVEFSGIDGDRRRRQRYTQQQRLAFTFYLLDALIGIPFLTIIILRQIHWSMDMETHVFLHGYFDAWLPWAIVTILIGLFRTGLSVWRPDVFGKRALTSISLFYGLITIIFGMLFTGMWAQIHGGIGCDGPGDDDHAQAVPGSGNMTMTWNMPMANMTAR